AYMSMFETSDVTLLDRAEARSYEDFNVLETIKTTYERQASADDWSDWTDWAINAVAELCNYNDNNSWDQTWVDPLWSWDAWSWDTSWDPWGLVFGLSFGALADGEEASSSSLERHGNFARVCCDFGVVDLNFGGFGEPSDIVPPALMAPLETFSLNGRTDETQRLFGVGDLGLKNLNTAFNHVALELGGYGPLDTFRRRSCHTVLSEGLCFGVAAFATYRRLVKVDFEGQPCFLHFYVCDVPIVGHGSLLVLRPTLAPFNKEEFEERWETKNALLEQLLENLYRSTLLVPEDSHFEEQLGNGRAKSRRLSLKQPVLRMDFSFLGDSLVRRAGAPYSQAELHRFALETGRTFGVLQCDPEPALRAIAIATSVTGEVGGLSFRSTLVGNMQATLYGQIEALRLEVLERYDVDLSTVTFATRKALQLSSDRWRKKYAGFLCRFGETAVSDQRFVADGSIAETDTFVFPAKRSGEATGLDPPNFAEEQQSTEPLATGDLLN
ncbi:unnamed protein product, partial [Symbiodinium sp. CCMP2456]